MTSKKNVSSAEVLDRIRRISAAAEWTDEELNKALTESGLDPNKLANAALSTVRRLNQTLSSTKVEATESTEESVPLLGVYRKRTNLKPAAIATALGVSVTFISDLNRHAKTVPQTWRKALAKVAKEALDIPIAVTLQAFEQPFVAPRAASRDEAYAKDTTTWEQILDRSGMSEAAKTYWRDLLDKE
jgi:transcriptional regulator with XRE-family HTH domain